MLSLSLGQKVSQHKSPKDTQHIMEMQFLNNFLIKICASTIQSEVCVADEKTSMLKPTAVLVMDLMVRASKKFLAGAVKIFLYYTHKKI